MVLQVADAAGGAGVLPAGVEALPARSLAGLRSCVETREEGAAGRRAWLEEVVSFFFFYLFLCGGGR
jgi:hypothetical protein